MDWKMKLLLLAPLFACATPAEMARRRGEATEAEHCVRVMDLRHADAGQVAQSVSMVFSERKEPSLRVAHDPRGNRVILAGPPDRVQAAAEVVERLDRQRPAHSEVLRLEHANAQEVANALHALLQKRAAVAYGTGVLLVTGSPEEIELLRRLVAELDRPAE